MTDRITDEMVEAAADILRLTTKRYVRAALSAALPLMDGWQPILTAPTDGTEIVLVDGSGARAVGSWEQYGWADEEKYDWFPLRNPTHWMPLPPAPKGDE